MTTISVVPPLETQATEPTEAEDISEDGIIDDDGNLVSEEADGGEEPNDKTPESPPIESLEDRFAKLEKQLKDKQAFIDERNAEIGKLRKLIPPIEEEKTKLHEVNNENFFEDPVGNTAKIAENQKLLEREKERRDQLAHEEQIKAHREGTLQIAPDFDENIDLIAEVLKQDGFDENGLKAFKANPHFYNPVVNHNLNARAKLMKRVNELEAENARLKGNPKKILDKVEQFSRQKPKITGGVPSTNISDEVDINSLTEVQISKLSYKQIDDLLKRSKRKR